MHLYGDVLKEYARLTRPGARLLSRTEYVKVIEHLIQINNSLQAANDDLEVQLEAERERRRKLQEERP